MTLSTIGHGTLAADELARLLHDAGVELVVDIRSHPGSRRHPHFGRAALERWLPDHGLAYVWEPGLGGRRPPRPDTPHTALTVPAFRGYADHMETAEFTEALDRVLAGAATRPAAVMCAESVWWRCHRRLLSDAAVLLRHETVLHVLHDGRVTEHRPLEEARVEGDRLVYDAGRRPLPGTAGA
ncbi:MAG TPA: DUF488 domain-containing protein [Acidimicrobiia bacterium]